MDLPGSSKLQEGGLNHTRDIPDFVADLGGFLFLLYMKDGCINMEL